MRTPRRQHDGGAMACCIVATRRRRRCCCSFLLRCAACRIGGSSLLPFLRVLRLLRRHTLPCPSHAGRTSLLPPVEVKCTAPPPRGRDPEGLRKEGARAPNDRHPSPKPAAFRRPRRCSC